MAKARQEAIGSDHPIVEQFWEAVEHIGFENLNHKRWSEEKMDIAINLNHFQSKAAKLGLKTPTVLELKRHLKSSRERKFICSNATVNSVCEDGEYYNHDRLIHEYPYKDKSVRCWIFYGPADPKAGEA